MLDASKNISILRFLWHLKPVRKGAKAASAKKGKPSKGKKDSAVILVTNDDGIMASGIMNLVEAVK